MNIGVLVSGQGTNLQALLDADLTPGRITIVISNKPGAPALQRAANAGVPARVIEHGDDRKEFETQLIAALDVDLVVLAGFMRVLTNHFVDHFANRIINTHPSLLPAFPGANAAHQAIAAGVKESGVTIHFVDNTLDGGPIIAQRAVPVLPGDDAATLQARIQKAEHQLLPEVVRDLAAGKLSCQGGAVVRRA